MSLPGDRGDSKRADEGVLTQIQLDLKLHGQKLHRRNIALDWRPAETFNSRFSYLPLISEDKTPGAPEQYQYGHVAVIDCSKVKENELAKLEKKESKPVTFILEHPNVTDVCYLKRERCLVSLGLNSVMFWDESGAPKDKKKNFTFDEVMHWSVHTKVHVVSDKLTVKNEDEKEEVKTVQNRIIQVMTSSPNVYVLDLTKQSQELKVIDFDILDSTLIGDKFLALLPKPAEDKINSDIFIYDATNLNFAEEGPIRIVQTKFDITNLRALPEGDLVLQTKAQKKSRLNFNIHVREMQIFHCDLENDRNAEFKLTGQITCPFDEKFLPTINEIGNLVFAVKDQGYLAAYDLQRQKMNDDYRVTIPENCRSVLSTNIGICMTCSYDNNILEFASLKNFAIRAEIVRALMSHGHPIFGQAGQGQPVDIIADYTGGSAQRVLPNSTEIMLKLDNLIRNIIDESARVHRFLDTVDALRDLIKDVSTEKFPTYSDCIRQYPSLGEILNKDKDVLYSHEEEIISLLKEMQELDKAHLKFGK